MRLVWHDNAWEEYLNWQQLNKQILKKINNLLKSIDRNGYKGLGHPEPLTGDLTGYWSRHIDEKNRIVYKIENDIVKIIQCGSHYRDK